MMSLGPSWALEPAPTKNKRFSNFSFGRGLPTIGARDPVCKLRRLKIQTRYGSRKEQKVAKGAVIVIILIIRRRRRIIIIIVIVIVIIIITIIMI